MHRFMRLLPATVVCVLLVACGDGALREEARAGAVPVVEAFVDALQSGDVNAAYALTTPDFRTAAPRERVAEVAASLGRVLGRRGAPSEAEVVSVTAGAGPQGDEIARAAVLEIDARFEKSAAKIEAGAARDEQGAWRVDACVVRSSLFEWTFRARP